MSFYRDLRALARPLKRILPRRPKLYYHDDFLSYVGRKKEGLLHGVDSIDTIALHSSVADYAFFSNVFDNAFNLGLTSSDLYTDFNIYNFARNSLNRLQNIVFFASVFAPGYNLTKTSERYRSVVYRHFFEVPMRDLSGFSGRFVSRIEQRCQEVSVSSPARGYSGYDQKTYFGTSIPAEDRARTHLRENFRSPNQMIWLQRILDSAEHAGQRVHIIIPPFRSDYKMELTRMVGPEEVVFREYFALNLGNHQIHSYYRSPDFGDECLGDTDHLNEEGARRLTREIMKKVSGSMA